MGSEKLLQQYWFCNSAFSRNSESQKIVYRIILIYILLSKLQIDISIDWHRIFNKIEMDINREGI